MPDIDTCINVGQWLVIKKQNQWQLNNNIIINNNSNKFIRTFQSTELQNASQFK